MDLLAKQAVREARSDPRLITRLDSIQQCLNFGSIWNDRYIDRLLRNFVTVMNKTITAAEWSLLKCNNHSSQSMNFDWEDIIASIDARQHIPANTVSLLSNNNTNNRSRGNSYRTDLNNISNLLDNNSRFFNYRHKIKIDIRKYNNSRNLDLEHLNCNVQNWNVITIL